MESFKYIGPMIGIPSKMPQNGEKKEYIVQVDGIRFDNTDSFTQKIMYLDRLVINNCMENIIIYPNSSSQFLECLDKFINDNLIKDTIRKYVVMDMDKFNPVYCLVELDQFDDNDHIYCPLEYAATFYYNEDPSKKREYDREYLI